MATPATAAGASRTSRRPRWPASSRCLPAFPAPGQPRIVPLIRLPALAVAAAGACPAARAIGLGDAFVGNPYVDAPRAAATRTTRTPARGAQRSRRAGVARQARGLPSAQMMAEPAGSTQAQDLGQPGRRPRPVLAPPADQRGLRRAGSGSKRVQTPTSPTSLAGEANGPDQYQYGLSPGLGLGASSRRSTQPHRQP